MKSEFLRKWLPLLLLYLFVVSNGQAQNPSQQEYQLFEYRDREAAIEKMSADQPEGAVIRVNREVEGGQALQSGDLLRFEIKRETVQYRVTRTTRYIESTLSVQAKSETDPDDYLLVTFSDGRMTGMLHTGSHSEHYHFNYDRQENATYIIKADPRSLGDFECAVDSEFQSAIRSGPETPDGMGKLKFEHQDQPLLSAKAVAPSIEDSITIDLMVVYSQPARDWSDNESEPGSIESVIAEAMNLAQHTFDLSNIAVKLRLVHTHETDYNESAGDPTMSDHVRRFAASSGSNRFGDSYQGYMEEVHGLRDEYGADLMMLLVDEPDKGGIGFILRRIEGDPELGFSVSNVRVIGRTGVFIHEIGHNLGGAHARDQQEAPATARGGIFEFSTGYRFIGPDDEGEDKKFSTIMAYTDEGEYQPVARFSGPDVLFRETPTGTYDLPYGPSDNSRSFQIIKRTVSDYHQTRFETPSASASQNNLVFDMDAEQTLQIPVFISNQGESDLMFQLDFRSGNLPSIQKETENPNQLKFQNRARTDRVSGFQALENPTPPSSQPPWQYSETAESSIYQTTFSSGEDYTPGTYTATQEWRTFFETDHTFEISQENPSSGSNHLRVNYLEGVEDTTIVRSPYFGPQPFGAYEFTADIAIRDNGREEPRFDLYLWDSRGERSDFMTAGLIFTRGIIFVRAPSGNFEPEGSYDSGEYRRLRIVTDPTAKQIRYYYNEQLIRTTPFISGISIGHFWLLHGNNQSDTWIDIDNIEVKRIHAPFRWLNLNRFGGVVKPDKTEEVMLEFSTFGIRGGSYNATMIIQTNDRDRESIEIPMRLNVDLEVPEALTLEQNFPNPYQRATTITFGLPESSHVQLEVYSVTGQRVKTLLNETRPAGTYYIPFNPGDLASGVYIYRLRTDFGSRDHKMVLIK